MASWNFLFSFFLSFFFSTALSWISRAESGLWRHFNLSGVNEWKRVIQGNSHLGMVPPEGFGQHSGTTLQGPTLAGFELARFDRTSSLWFTILPESQPSHVPLGVITSLFLGPHLPDGNLYCYKEKI